MVSSYQNAFVMGRQILDGSLIANEVINSWQKKRRERPNMQIGCREGI